MGATVRSEALSISYRDSCTLNSRRVMHFMGLVSVKPSFALEHAT
jgi:hypothetical protein